MNSQGLLDIEESLHHLTQRTKQDNRNKEMQKKTDNVESRRKFDKKKKTPISYSLKESKRDIIFMKQDSQIIKEQQRALGN